MIDEVREPAAQRRLDDLKQYWYFYYLVETQQDKPSSAAMRELMWKGQMSYANASHMIARTIFGTDDPAAAAGDFSKGPAHFTSAETAGWWAKLLDHWPLVTVSRFADATLANGKPANSVDLNDLVPVAAFGREPPTQAFLYNSGYQTPPTFLCAATQAGEEIGCQLYWPADPTGKDGYYIARDLPYGIGVWNAKAAAVVRSSGGKAKRAGTYRNCMRSILTVMATHFWSRSGRSAAQPVMKDTAVAFFVGLTRQLMPSLWKACKCLTQSRSTGSDFSDSRQAADACV